MLERVIRLAKRRTSWESHDVDELVETEFQRRDGALDLSPSVYVFDAADDGVAQTVTQVRAEHLASFLNPPTERGYGTNVDLHGTLSRPLKAQLGTTRFRFTVTAHREADFADRQELVSTLQQVMGSVSQRLHDASRTQVLSYIHSCRTNHDCEWEALLRDPTKKGWLAEVDKHAGKQTNGGAGKAP